MVFLWFSSNMPFLATCLQSSHQMWRSLGADLMRWNHGYTAEIHCSTYKKWWLTTIKNAIYIIIYIIYIYTLYIIIWYYMILYDIIWYYMILYDIIWYYMILYDIICRHHTCFPTPIQILDAINNGLVFRHGNVFKKLILKLNIPSSKHNSQSSCQSSLAALSGWRRTLQRLPGGCGVPPNKLDNLLRQWPWPSAALRSPHQVHPLLSRAEWEWVTLKTS